MGDRSLTTHSDARAEPVAERRGHTWQRATGPVDDPWAWLADRHDPATHAYLEAENAHTDTWFAEPAHADLVETVYGEIRSRVQETDVSVPTFHGGWYYVTRTIEDAAYPVYCRGRTSDSARDGVVLDCNLEATAHGFFAVSAFEPSHDHTRLAWAADTAGDELYRLRVRALDSGADLDDIEDTAAGGVAWSADGAWLFYLRSDEQRRPFEVWRHQVGGPVDGDVCIYREDDERFYVGVESTRSGDWITISAESQRSSEAHLVDSRAPLDDPTVVRPRADDVEYLVEHWGDRFVIVTNLDAPDFRVMTAPLERPGEWSELVAHVPSRRIINAEPFAGHLVIHEWAEAQQRLRVLMRDGSERILDTGEEPHEVEFGPNPEWETTELRYRTQSLNTPPSLYGEDVVTGERELLKITPTPNVDLAAYVSERTWATADDGTRVPVDVVRHVGTTLDASAPCVVYGYGAYEASMPPWFSVARLSLLDRGAVWALVHPRGGGEMGRSWYEDGRLLHKRNTFTDTLAAVDHLVAGDWADGGRICVRGGSAGGLLVGACVTMRPGRFASAIAEVPFVDVVTTMSDPTLPLTVTEWEEWGDPREQPFADYIASYSPYDNTAPGDYPAIYVTAGINDIRVSYHEPAKWIAKLRAVRTERQRPLLLHTEMGAGHSGPSGRYDAWRDEAKVLTFILATT
jgi:oligopeptidase B